jgi:hypothetical protein
VIAQTALPLAKTAADQVPPAFSRTLVCANRTGLSATFVAASCRGSLARAVAGQAVELLRRPRTAPLRESGIDGLDQVGARPDLARWNALLSRSPAAVGAPAAPLYEALLSAQPPVQGRSRLPSATSTSRTCSSETNGLWQYSTGR